MSDIPPKNTPHRHPVTPLGSPSISAVQSVSCSTWILSELGLEYAIWSWGQGLGTGPPSSLSPCTAQCGQQVCSSGPGLLAGGVFCLCVQLCRGEAIVCWPQGGRLPPQPLLGLHHAGPAHLHSCLLQNEASHHGLHQSGEWQGGLCPFSVPRVLLASGARSSPGLHHWCRACARD